MTRTASADRYAVGYRSGVLPLLARATIATRGAILSPCGFSPDDRERAVHRGRCCTLLLNRAYPIDLVVILRFVREECGLGLRLNTAGADAPYRASLAFADSRINKQASASSTIRLPTSGIRVTPALRVTWLPRSVCLPGLQ